MPDYALSDLKIVEIAGHDMPVAGSYCTKILADHGAQVTRIHSPSDESAQSKSARFLYLNTGKENIVLDLTQDAGFEAFEELVMESDVVVETIGPGAIEYPALAELNPSIILASISWFGQDAPYCGYKGSDIVAQALSGVMHFTGLADREPLKIAGPQAEYQAGTNAAVAIMTALYFRDETGQGQYIDISAMEALASILEGALLSYAYDGTVRGRDGARHPTVCPSTILPCKDGFMHVDASTVWETFVRFTGIKKLLDFDPQTLRQYADEIEKLLIPWLAGYTRDEVFEEAQAWRLPFAKVMGVDELLDDPQFQARNYFDRMDNLVSPGEPFKMNDGGIFFG